MFFEHQLNIAQTAAGLAIKGAKNAAATVANTTNFRINGEMFYITTKDVAIATDYKGVAITIENDMQCVLSVFTDIAGTIYVAKGTEYTDAHHYNTKYVISDLSDKALLGYIYIKNNTGSQFVGGTTALDVANTTVSYRDAYTCLGK